MKTFYWALFFDLYFVPLSSQTILKPLPLSSLTYDSTTLSLDDTAIWSPREQHHVIFDRQWQKPNYQVNQRLHCTFIRRSFLTYPMPEGREEQAISSFSACIVTGVSS